MAHNNKTYAIVPIAQLNNINYSEVEQTDATTVRKNLAETEFVVKWEGSTPASVSAINPAPIQYNHENILVEMAKETWINVNEL